MNNCSRGKLLVDLVKKYKEAEKVEQNLNAISEENHNIMQEVAACTSSQNPIITESSSQNYADFDEISNDFSSDDTIRDKTWQPEDDQEVNFTLNETNFSAEENIDPNKNREHENVSVISRNNDGTEENNENCEGVKKSRKRKRNVENWSQNIRKSNKNSGKSYTTMKGKIIPEKKVRIACPGSCKFKCNMLFDETMRQKIFDNFWGLSDLSLQRNFIAKNVDKVVTKYRYTREGSKRIGLNHAYNFYNSEGDRTRVCKKFFMTTLDVGDRFIRTAILKIKDNLHSIDEDRRGKHNNHQKIPEDVLTSIKDHINSFPRIEAHYIRKQTEREYIEGSLTIAEMYRLYKKKCAENNIEPAKLCTYSKVFNECFNISFFLPKKDQCAFCAKYNNCSNEEKCQMENEYEGHRKEIARSREQKEKDKDISAADAENFITVCYDLQSVLSTPSSHVSNFYYSRKFSSYNFTMFNMASKKGYCYLWHEDQGRRGANEIGTCIFKFLTTNCSHKNVIFYSDNCMGQQKNKFIAAMYIFVVKNYNIKSIEHKFLIVGHTQNEGDSMHSVIEKNISRTAKAGPIYSPMEWRIILQNSKKKNPTYEVNELNYKDFLDLKKLTEDLGKNFNINSRKEKVKWSDIKILKIQNENPNILYYKTNYDSDFSEIHIVEQKTRKSTSNIPTEMSNVFSEPVGISAQKKKDLTDLCDKLLIPENHHYFYKNLKISTQSVEEHK